MCQRFLTSGCSPRHEVFQKQEIKNIYLKIQLLPLRTTKWFGQRPFFNYYFVLPIIISIIIKNIHKRRTHEERNSLQLACSVACHLCLYGYMLGLHLKPFCLYTLIVVAKGSFGAKWFQHVCFIASIKDNVWIPRFISPVIWKCSSVSIKIKRSRACGLIVSCVPTPSRRLLPRNTLLLNCNCKSVKHIRCKKVNCNSAGSPPGFTTL